MESDSDDDGPTVYVAGKPHPLDDVVENPELIDQMTPQEKDSYIKIYQDTFSHIHD